MNFVDKCESIAREHFNIQKLTRPQRTVLDILNKKSHVLATLPTGSGKTLLYALPAMVFKEGLVIVISPLISLIRDQALRMAKASIPVAYLTSEQDDESKRKQWQDIKRQRVKMVFVSPERFVHPDFFEQIKQTHISMVTVDEAHCAVTWGNQFRPEYGLIAKVLQDIDPKKVLALTATASSSTCLEIIDRVFHKKDAVETLSFFPLAKNIVAKSVRTYSKKSQWSKLLLLLKESESKKIIVYFQTRKLCELASKAIKKENLKSCVYHAGIEKEFRKSTEDYIRLSNEKIIICATSAFGMGIDLNNVSLVIVFGFPIGIEDFFQMIGRAGRKGEKSQGVLLWTGSCPIKRDYHLQRSFLDKKDFLTLANRFLTVIPKQKNDYNIVTRSQMSSYLDYNSLSLNSEDLKDQYLENTISVLRISGALCDLVDREEYFSFEENDQEKFLENLSFILAKLPAYTTKRSLVFNALKKIVHDNAFYHSSKNKFLISLKEFKIRTSLKNSCIKKVMLHYRSQFKFNFEVFKGSESYILRGNESLLNQDLKKYLSIRKGIFESFNELLKFAKNSSCRLRSLRKYFSSSMDSHEDSFCKQCDYCESKSFNKDVMNQPCI